MRPLNEWCNIQGDDECELQCESGGVAKAKLRHNRIEDSESKKSVYEEDASAYADDEDGKCEDQKDCTYTYVASCDFTTAECGVKCATMNASEDSGLGESSATSAYSYDEEGDLTVACAQLKADIRATVLSSADFTALCRLFRGLALRDAESLEADAEDIQRFVESRLAAKLHAQSNSAVHACSLVLRLQKLVALEARLCELRERE